MVAVTFRHDTSRNLDPQLHTHCVIANMVQGGDGKVRYRGVAKNRQRIALLLGFSNLLIAGRYATG